jgi:RNA polymerase sigma factor (sigma-70 family)
VRSDAELIQCFVASRDEGAFGQLVERHWGSAYRLAYRCLGDAPAAEDVAQEVFVRLARLGGSDWKLRGPFGAYLRTLVLNAARDAAKMRTRRRQHEGHARDTAPTSHEPELEGGLAAEELRVELLRLPDELRAALVLRYYEERSHREVAEALGCPAGTASSRIRRGLDKLREALEPSAARAGGLTAAAIGAALASAPVPAGAAPAAPAASGLLALAGQGGRQLIAVAAAGLLGLLFLLGVVAWAWGPWASAGPAQVAGAADPALSASPEHLPETDAGSAALDASDEAPTEDPEQPLAPPSEEASGGEETVGAAKDTRGTRAKEDASPVKLRSLPTLRGTVRDARSGVPLAGAEVFCVRDPEDRRSVAAVSTSSPSGEFQLPLGRYALFDRKGRATAYDEQTPVGAFLLVIRAPGYRSFLRALRASEVGERSLDALLEPAPRAGGVRARLVLSGSRVAVAGVRVLVHLRLSLRAAQGRFDGELRAPAAASTGGSIGWSLQSDAEGRVELWGLPAGRVTLLVAEGQRYARALSVLSRDGETRVELKPGADLLLAIRGESPRVTLTRLDTGQEEPRAETFFARARRELLIRGLLPGRYRVTASFTRPGKGTSDPLPECVETLPLAAGGVHRVSLGAPVRGVAASLRVRVVDAEGKALSKRGVTVARADADDAGYANYEHTDDKGEIHLRDLAPAKYRVRVQGSGQREVVLAAGAELEVVVRPNVTGILSAQVLDPRGRPVVGAEVSAGYAEGSTDARGRFRLEVHPEDLGFEELGICVSKAGFLSLTHMLERGRALPARLVLTPGRDLSVSVTLAEKAPRDAAAYLAFFPEDGSRPLRAASPQRRGLRLVFRLPHAPRQRGRLALRVGYAPTVWREVSAGVVRHDLGELTLPKGREVRGRLAGGSSSEVGFYTVGLPHMPSSPRLGLPLELAADGSFVLTGLPLKAAEVVLIMGDRWQRMSLAPGVTEIAPVRLRGGAAPLPPSMLAFEAPVVADQGEARITLYMDGIQLGDLLKLVASMCGKTIEVPAALRARKVKAGYRETPWRKVVEDLAGAVGCRVEERSGGVALVARDK